ncbi:MAG: hypothetical protein IPP94_18935 [Ignavibacteria bacterium]|nr:hypothetical protein [Ignavibacteria bacterium]
MTVMVAGSSPARGGDAIFQRNSPSAQTMRMRVSGKDSASFHEMRDEHTRKQARLRSVVRRDARLEMPAPAAAFKKEVLVGFFEREPDEMRGSGARVGRIGERHGDVGVAERDGAEASVLLLVQPSHAQLFVAEEVAEGVAVVNGVPAEKTGVPRRRERHVAVADMPGAEEVMRHLVDDFAVQARTSPDGERIVHVDQLVGVGSEEHDAAALPVDEAVGVIDAHAIERHRSVGEIEIGGCPGEILVSPGPRVRRSVWILPVRTGEEADHVHLTVTARSVRMRRDVRPVVVAPEIDLVRPPWIVERAQRIPHNDAPPVRLAPEEAFVIVLLRRIGREIKDVSDNAESSLRIFVIVGAEIARRGASPDRASLPCGPCRRGSGQTLRERGTRISR